MDEKMINGFINIDKEKGMTSASAINRLKRILRQQGIVTKIGHFGTLDPDGEGVLPVALGRATRLFDYFTNQHNKTYFAIFKFGLTTDTLDESGVILKNCDKIPSMEEIIELLPGLVGVQWQIPPQYSAKSVNGVRAYDLARKGIEVVLPPKQIEIYSIKFVEQIDTDTFSFQIECSGGTYIRSIARDLGDKLSSLAIMTYIKRINSGDFNISTAVKLSVLEQSLENHILPMDYLLNKFTRFDAPMEREKDILNGLKICLNDMPDGFFCVYLNNNPIGIAERFEERRIKIRTWLL